MKLLEKTNKLIEYIKSFGKLAIAYSSGVDSTFLLDYACEVLGKDNVCAMTIKSATFPGREYNEALEFCESRGIQHFVIEVDEMQISGFSENPVDRCYICKKSIFSNIIKKANEYGYPVVAEGSNMDDNGDYRPGLRAIDELGIISPLRYAGLYKSEIRLLSQDRGLPTWQKPSFACLASRFAYGETITKEKLCMVEKAEQLLLDMGLAQLRVRIHGNENLIARIEVLEDDIELIISNRRKIYEKFAELGFAYTALDLKGYRTGSMNAAILKETK